ncbi:hypothetical protein DEU56DRAFT_756522 [Suillus clintonianus]|uniref:uncharacterized protein n=1 Tax=Suillus clintonianus TaxID=1904413 RepID=UPI001B85BB6C|nr:uncharacterized protein DEU56DRAFT_756522 [Suillus clintonianus]KAG2135836.1 hypothetical protein DEU56DRAFT_756522 [Suillus clintonianus]
MATCGAIKVELPVDVTTFKFTFECRTAGPVTIEISITQPLQMLCPQAGTVKGPDVSGTHTEVPGVFTNWLGAIEAGPPAVDDSVTEPESELGAEEPKLTAQALVGTGLIVDDSETEPESDQEIKDEPATPAEFHRWYNEKKKAKP